VPIHHWAWTALSGHSASKAGPLLASHTLAVTAIQLLASPDTVAAAKAELRERTGGVLLPPPRAGADETLAVNPQSFWDATWQVNTDEGLNAPA